jgi:uncharacterized protein (TIGR00251 family)
MEVSTRDPVSESDRPYRWIEADLELEVHAQPGARRTEVRGIHGNALKISLQARAVDNAANEALIEFLAATLQVPRRRCAIVSGHTSRRKRVRIESPDRAVAERWLQTIS